MKRTHHEEPYIRQDALTDRLFDEHSICFDIETDGFSPAGSTVYLIGCAYRSKEQLCVDQFFAEQPSEEEAVLTAFLDLLTEYRTIISFNGTGFDIPFLKARCERHKLPEHFQEFHCLDIFKGISRLKFLLGLPNYRQKTIENFLNLSREDAFSGGELIVVYHNYVQNPTEEESRLLHLHNYEDVVGMTKLLPVLSYLELFHGSFSIRSARVAPYRCYDGSSGEELILTLQNNYPVPRRVSHRCGLFYLITDSRQTSIRVPVYQDELRYFYPNYKDYYYLPAEDMAVHRSVASFVDKAYRENARAANCYSRKTGSYLPQYACVIQPQFRREYKDKLTYFELTEDFCSSEVMLRRYAEHILNYMFHAKT